MSYINNGYFHKHDIFTKRFWRLLFQYLRDGWDDSDTWSLNYTLSKIILPRLKRFKELNIGWPSKSWKSDGFKTFEDWEAALDDMIYAMDINSRLDDISPDTAVDWERVKRGNYLFGKFFNDLWW